ncbi:1-phosphofructokinase [Senegalia massiliensis]|uniref:Tagatose-6-phosphate kinase n=1 Tax=Senegalia massiliensis TaxID=1720316 RepID=A0A845QUE9_9CLOT|nr:1-phosphofructokinase [Senegalia massiliensis]NBI06497.1 1-phosphofructokinase [Senegalia massiliensis]
MIYTVTFNPAIDYNLEIDKINFGETNRAKDTYIYPGGKGINISRVLYNLEVESTALGFIGGFTGKYLEEYLKKSDINTDFIYLDEPTRINVKLKSEIETEINAIGPDIPDEKIEEFYKKIDKLKDGDFLILAGNIQSSLRRDMYFTIQERCSEKNINIIVDTTGESLEKTLSNNPFLIKPNKKELEEIFNIEIKDNEDIIKYGQKLQRRGAENVIVSMGGDGAILLSENEVHFVKSPKGILKNSVGSGDSMIAGFLSSYTKTKDVLNSFRWAVAAGSATAFSSDLAKKEEVEQLLDNIVIERLK